MDINSLPKIELHCHLDGIIDPGMARVLRQRDPAFPLDPEYLAGAYPVYDFESFINWWRFIGPVEGSLRHFYPILGQYIQQLKAQNVHYAEIMISGGELPLDHAQAVDEAAAYRAWTNQQEAGLIQVEFLVALGRHKPLERLERLAETVLALFDAGLVVGVALAGVEPGYPVQPMTAIFERFHDAGLGIEIHAGEWCGAESIWDALEHGHPDRIGHGVSLFDDARLLDRVLERQIHVEMCPTSNLKTGSVESIDQHPVRRARELGLNFSINTDDPGPFECSLATEYALVADTFGFTADDFARMYTNALAARFQPALRNLKIQ
jgi:adenosine deaminase